MTGLLDLPIEVRLMIYRRLLPQEDFFVDDPFCDRSIPNVHAGIIGVNSQTALEALPILYSQITFYIIPRRTAIDWLRQIEQTNRDLLRKVTCELPWIEDPDHTPELFGLLARCSNVSLTLEVYSIRDLMWTDSSGVESFKSMHGFASTSIDLKPSSESTCYKGHDPQASCAVLQQRWDNAILKMRSPCPNYCWAHRGQSRSQATASLHITFNERHCLTCTGRKFAERWYKTNSNSIFKL